MAKFKQAGSENAAAVAEQERRVTSHDFGDSDRGPSPAERAPAVGGPAGGIYKPGQGYYTRMWTAIGFGAMVVWLVAFVWEKLTILTTSPKTTLIIQVSASVAIIALFAYIGFRLLGRNQKVCDFMIATEGEMKKVNWTSRKEIIGSTKVVIFVLVAMSVLLFVVDLIFMLFFSWIGVLKGKGMFEILFGGGA